MFESSNMEALHQALVEKMHPAQRMFGFVQETSNSNEFVVGMLRMWLEAAEKDLEKSKSINASLMRSFFTDNERDTDGKEQDSGNKNDKSHSVGSTSRS